MKKLKIMVVPSDVVGGVGFYRSIQPHERLKKNYGDEFEIDIVTSPDWKDLAKLETYDIIHVHKGLFNEMKAFYDAIIHLKNTKTVTVMDIDDSWDLSPTHPQYALQKNYGLDKLIQNNLRLFDYVTTTTKIFAEEIFPYNKNVVVLPNSINPNDERFKINKPISDKIRVGMIMGAQHEYDVKIVENFVKKLSKEAQEKIQIVLCGFDIRGVYREIDPKTKKTVSRSMMPEETTWYRYEQMLTDNYKIVSPKYKRFLHMFVPNLDYPDTEHEMYRRCWTKDINHYYSHYNNVDILLAPLEPKHFNYVKSELKAIECCFSKTALIASNYGPYKMSLTNAIVDGNFSQEGNAILVDTDKGASEWAKYIEMLVMDNEKMHILQENIYNSFKDNYCLDKVTRDRRDFYQTICKYNKTEE